VAEGSDEDDRSEAASEQRLQHAYDQGQVPVGPAIAAAGSLAAVTAMLLSQGGPLCSELVSLLQAATGSLPTTPFATLGQAALRVAGRVTLIGLAASLASVAATLAQTRGGFWPELVFPDVERLFRTKALFRPFSLEFVGDLGVALVKVVAVGGVTFTSARDTLLTLPAQMALPAPQMLRALFGALAHAGARGVFALVVVAGVDLAVARYRFHQRMRMTRDEVKRERREEDGDPLIRRRRRRAHRGLLKHPARLEVPKADALVVNPTHIAIAIRYRSGEGRAPRVVAKGKDVIAEHLRELAREHGVPIIEDIALARLLYKKVRVGREVPADTYRAVAVVLAQVYKMTGRRGGGVRA
jgi:flagellar biosynthetic protein FlhB